MISHKTLIYSTGTYYVRTVELLISSARLGYPYPFSIQHTGQFSANETGEDTMTGIPKALGPPACYLIRILVAESLNKLMSDTHGIH